MVLGPKPMGKPNTWIKKKIKKKGFEFRKMGYLIKTSSHFVYGLNTIEG